MNKRRLFLKCIVGLSVVFCSVSCADTDDRDDIVTVQENVKSKTNKPSSPSAKDTLIKSSGTSKSESAREVSDSTGLGNINEIQETREPRRLQPDTGTEPGTGTDPETIDPTKPDRPK